MHHVEAEHEIGVHEGRGDEFREESGPHEVASSGPDHRHVDMHPHVPGPLSTIEQAQENKYHRQMDRTRRHPVHHNSHRITF